MLYHILSTKKKPQLKGFKFAFSPSSALCVGVVVCVWVCGRWWLWVWVYVFEEGESKRKRQNQVDRQTAKNRERKAEGMLRRKHYFVRRTKLR